MPLVMTQDSPNACAASTGRASTLFSALTTITSALPRGSRLTAACGSMITFSRLPSASCARTYMPGSRSRRGFGNTARSVTLPVPGSTAASVSSSRPASG